MKAVILAGGLGTRLSEETVLRPKPMVEIGGKPILWHIMQIHAVHGITEFVIALGYKGEMIKEYFLNFFAINNDLSVDLSTGKTTIHDGNQPKWTVHLADTGLTTQTGGRVKRLKKWLEGDDTFMLTYGDGVADLDIHKLLEFHRSHGKLATMTSVRSPARFGRSGSMAIRLRNFLRNQNLGRGGSTAGFLYSVLKHWTILKEITRFGKEIRLSDWPMRVR